jgi:hypothetical protein
MMGPKGLPLRAPQVQKRLSSTTLGEILQGQSIKADNKRKQTEVQMQSLKSLTADSYTSLRVKDKASASPSSSPAPLTPQTPTTPSTPTNHSPIIVTGTDDKPGKLRLEQLLTPPAAATATATATPPSTTTTTTSSTNSNTEASTTAILANPNANHSKTTGAFRRISNRISRSVSPVDISNESLNKRTFFIEQLLANPESFTLAAGDSATPGDLGKWLAALAPLSESLARLIDITVKLLQDTTSDDHSELRNSQRQVHEGLQYLLCQSAQERLRIVDKPIIATEKQILKQCFNTLRDVCWLTSIVHCSRDAKRTDLRQTVESVLSTTSAQCHGHRNVQA